METLVFLDIRGQLTRESLVESGRNSTSSKRLLLSLLLLSARMKKVHLKMKTLEWAHFFSYCKSIGIVPDAK